MYFVEWLLWRAATEHVKTKKHKNSRTNTFTSKINHFYESDVEQEQLEAQNIASETPFIRGPVYKLTPDILEVRAGLWEDKRGLVSLLSLTILSILIASSWLLLTNASYLIYSRGEGENIASTIYLTSFLTIYITTGTYFYLRYGMRFTRLEMFTSRHQIVRFNRTTQQVYLHRPNSCGGVISLPWRGITATGSSIKNATTATGFPLFIYWPPSVTGTYNSQCAWIGKATLSASELCNEWEFIRRFMNEGPETLPRPRLTSHFPWPWQAFTPQFEGLTHYFWRASRVIKIGLVLISPAFLVIGLGHWLSLLLCWKPRWPKIIREAGFPGKPVPPLTTLADYPLHIQERLRDNAHLWAVRPGKCPETKTRATRGRKEETHAQSSGEEAPPPPDCAHKL